MRYKIDRGLGIQVTHSERRCLARCGRAAAICKPFLSESCWFSCEIMEAASCLVKPTKRAAQDLPKEVRLKACKVSRAEQNDHVAAQSNAVGLRMRRESPAFDVTVILGLTANDLLSMQRMALVAPRVTFTLELRLCGQFENSFLLLLDISYSVPLTLLRSSLGVATYAQNTGRLWNIWTLDRRVRRSCSTNTLRAAIENPVAEPLTFGRRPSSRCYQRTVAASFLKSA